jgi:cytochrome c-type biogenesis protein CcmH
MAALGLLVLVVGMAAVPAASGACSVPVAAVLAEATPTPGSNPASVSDDRVNAVARQMYCPVCENIPLDVCPTQACAEWRELIRLKLSQGWTDQQIQQYFAEQYGARVLAMPPRQGFFWLIYVLPPVFILLGIYILFRVFRSMRPGSGRPAAAASSLPVNGATAAEVAEDPYMKQMEEELKKRG